MIGVARAVQMLSRRELSAEEDAQLHAMARSIIVKGVESHYRDVRTLKGQFTQTYSWGDTKRTESGVAYFSRGGLMRWVYLQPKDKLVVSDGKTV